MPPPLPLPPPPITSYAALAPQEVLSALDAVGLRGDGRLLQLNSYENRVYQVFLESGDAVVVKFYRPGRWTDAQILEEHAFARELEEAEVPVVAPMSLQPLGEGSAASAPDPATDARSNGVSVAGHWGTLATWSHEGATWRFAVTPRKSGRAPEIDDPDTLRWIGRFVARLHDVGARRPFEHRRTLDVPTIGMASQRWLLDSGCLTPAEWAAWEDASTRALEAAAQAFDRWSSSGAAARIRLHGDAHPGNILWREEGPHVVDLDDASNGPAVQDLWMLLPGDETGRARSLRLLLEGYETVRDFDDAELALIEPLRSLRMIQHSAWIAQRWEDPAFPRAFPHFGTAAYWSEQTAQLREQLG
jgi:Ser/Thr protein kinase RdoA (MazF antagonist)